MAAHSLFGPSGLKRGRGCPGSYALIDVLRKEGLIAPDSTSEAAAKGTVGHLIAEQCLLRGKDAKDWVGVAIEQDGFMFEIDEGFANDVQTYVDAVRMIPGERMIEKRLKIDAFPKEAGEQFGTADCIILDKAKRTLYVIDLKMGSGVKVDV